MLIISTQFQDTCKNYPFTPSVKILNPCIPTTQEMGPALDCIYILNSFNAKSFACSPFALILAAIQIQINEYKQQAKGRAPSSFQAASN